MSWHDIDLQMPHISVLCNSCLIEEQQSPLTLEHSNLQVNRGNNPLKIALGSQWNWADSLSLFLSNSIEAVKTTERHRQAKLQWTLSDKPSPLKKSRDQPRCLKETKKDTLQAAELPEGCVARSRFPAWMSCHYVGVAFGDVAVFKWFLLL